MFGIDDVLSGVLDVGKNFLGSFLGNDMARDNAEDNRNFQMVMSDTAYSRAVDDLKRAGLNPMLAFQGKGGIGPLSTPAGSMATPPVTTASSGMLMAAQLDQIKAGTRKMDAEAALAAEQAKQASTQAEVNSAQVGGIQSRIFSDASQRGLWDKTREMLDSQIQEIGKRMQYTDAQIEQAQQHVKEMRQHVDLMVSQGKEREAMAKLLGEEGMTEPVRRLLMQLDIPEAQARARYATRVGELSPALHDLGKAMGSAGQAAGMFRDFAIGQRYGVRRRP